MKADSELSRKGLRIRYGVVYEHCQKCGNPLDEQQKKNKQKYCSRSCTKWRLITTMSICKVCGVQYKKKARDRKGLYCSRECSFKDTESWQISAKKEPPFGNAPKCAIHFYKCIVCGELQLARNSQRRMCPQCEPEYNRIRSREYEQLQSNKEPRPCRICGKIFTPEYGSKRRFYCGDDECIKEVRRRGKGKRKPESNRAQKSRRRARLRGAKVERFSHKEIFMRDGWKCQLCGHRCLKTAKLPHPRSPTLDHIIALADGGTHERRNVQLACFQCNCKKGAKALGQLRMC